jgi:hypothetical protein
LVWVVGDAGIRKTALLRRWLSEVDEQLVWVSGALEERELPLGLVGQLMGGLETPADPTVELRTETSRW